MRGAITVTVQLLVAAAAIAAAGGLIGLLIIEFATSKSAVTGLGWGMIGAGAIIGLAAGGSGSPSENLVRGRMGYSFNYWGQSNPLPQSPLQLAIGGLLAFGAGIALLVLTY